MNVRAAVEEGLALYVRLVDPATGASGFVAIEPAIRPHSPLRFYRGRPPHVPSTQDAATRGTKGH